VLAELDAASGTATVDFDQRVNTTPTGPGSLVPADFVLNAADGSILAAASGTPWVTQSSGPSDSFVALQYTPQGLARAAFLEIQAGAVSTFGGSGFTAAPSGEGLRLGARASPPSSPLAALRASHLGNANDPGPGRKPVIAPTVTGLRAAKPHKAAKKHKKH